jgi:predicted type IV restriction endonuclease
LTATARNDDDRPVKEIGTRKGQRMGGHGEAQQLSQVIKAIAAKVPKYRDRALGEQNTKASLIEPILEALGWDIRDPDEVHREFRPISKDSPVDYALKLIRKPRLFLEAKGLGEDLSDRKWIAQVLGYAVVAGVEWCVLSDGDCYRFYNAAAPVDADEKLFCTLRLTESNEADALKTLSLISRRNMEDNLLDVLWSAHFVDRRVKEAVRSMFASVDRSLVRLIHRKTVKLTPKDIAEALRRLDVRVDLATIPSEARKTSSRQATAKPASRPTGVQQPRRKAHFAVKLSDLIAAGLLRPPLPLFRKYRGKQMEATLLPDGTVQFQGNVYKTCSTAAEVARSTVTGRRMNTNGWSFWQFRDGNGKSKELIAVRSEYLASADRA